MNQPSISRTSLRRVERDQALSRAFQSGRWNAAARLMANGRTYTTPFELRNALIAEWIKRGRGIRH
jgi:hypothetical protein